MNKRINCGLFLATLFVVIFAVIKAEHNQIFIATAALMMGMLFEIMIFGDGLNQSVRKTGLIFLRYWVSLFISTRCVPGVLVQSDYTWMIKAILSRHQFYYLLAAVILLVLVCVCLNQPKNGLGLLLTSGLAMYATIQMSDIMCRIYGFWKSEIILLTFLVVYVLMLGRAFFNWIGCQSGSEAWMLLGNWGWILLILSIYSEQAIIQVSNLLELGWVFPTVLLGLGALMLLGGESSEEEAFQKEFHSSRQEETGAMMIAWAIFLCLTHWMPQYQGEFSACAIPAAYLVRIYLMKLSAEENYQIRLFGKKIGPYAVMIYFWTLGIVGAMAMMREMETNRPYILLVLALLVVRSICRKLTEEQGRRLAMARFWGVAWLVLALGVSFDFKRIPDSLNTMAAALILAVLWCVHCGVIEKLNRSESHVFDNEYSRVAAAQKAVPAGLAFVTVLLMLTQ